MSMPLDSHSDEERRPDPLPDEEARAEDAADGSPPPGPEDATTAFEAPVAAEPEPEAEPEPDPPDPDATVEWVPDEDEDPPTAVNPAADPELEALRDTEFAVVWRGYDVQAVDAYTAAVQRAVERFEERTYPTAAVQRALDRVGEQTAGILREAEQSAEETTRASRAQADDRLQRAEREAAEVQAGAIARVRSLDDDIERLWQERQRLIDATKELADQLRATAADAEARFPPADPSAGALPPRPPVPADDGPPLDLDP